MAIRRAYPALSLMLTLLLLAANANAVEADTTYTYGDETALTTALACDLTNVTTLLIQFESNEPYADHENLRQMTQELVGHVESRLKEMGVGDVTVSAYDKTLADHATARYVQANVSYARTASDQAVLATRFSLGKVLHGSGTDCSSRLAAEIYTHGNITFGGGDFLRTLPHITYIERQLDYVCRLLAIASTVKTHDHTKQ